MHVKKLTASILLALTLAVPFVAEAANQCINYDNFVDMAAGYVRDTFDTKIAEIQAALTSSAATTTTLIGDIGALTTALNQASTTVAQHTLSIAAADASMAGLRFDVSTATSSIATLTLDFQAASTSLSNLVAGLQVSSTSIALLQSEVAALSVGLATSTASTTQYLYDLSLRLDYASTSIQGIADGLAMASSSLRAVIDLFILSTATTTAETLTSILALQASTTELYTQIGQLQASSTDYLTRILNLETLMPFPQPGGGSITTFTSANIAQTAHGFVVGDWLYYNGTAWAKTDSDASTTAEAIGVVAAGGVVDADTFKLTYDGLVDLTGAVYAPLTAGQVYYISGTSGQITVTEPSAATSVSKPVMVAVSTTGGYINNFRGTPSSGVTPVVQSGSVILNNQVFNTPSLVTSTNGTYAIPSAGTWFLRYDIFTDGSGVNADGAMFAITNSVGTVINGTERTRSGGSTVAESISAEVIVVTTGATNYFFKGRSTPSGNVTVLNSTAGQSTITWQQVGSSPVPLSLAGEYGENTSITDAQTTTSTSFVDVTGGSVPLPTAGTWEIDWRIFFNNNTANNAVEFRLADSTGVAVANTSTYSRKFFTDAFTFPVSNTVFVTTSGASTYKLQWRTTANTATIRNNAPVAASTEGGNSKVTWRKISGFTPSSGQTVDYGYFVPTVDTTVTAPSDLTMTNSWTTSSGNIPITSAGVITLTAGKTYKLEANLSNYDAGPATVAYQFVDSGSNTPIGTSQPIFNSIPVTSGTNLSSVPASFIYTPSSNQSIKIRVLDTNGAADLEAAGLATNWRGGTYISITQLGSSAVIAGPYPGTWTSYTPTITSVGGTNPTLPTGATITGSYSIQGKTMFLNIRYNSAAVTGGADGTGSYQWSIPGGYTIDTTKAAIPSVLTNTAGSGLDGGVVGSGFGRNSTGGNSAGLLVMPLSATTIGAWFEPQTRLIGAGALAMTGASNTMYSFVCQIPLQ